MIDDHALAHTLPDLPGAVCQSVDSALFFGDGDNGRSSIQAKRICAGCPERLPCLEYALADPGLLGIWGGLTTRERVDMRRGRPVRPSRVELIEQAVTLHADGLTHRQIADEMHLHIDTIRTYIRSSLNEAQAREISFERRVQKAAERAAAAVELAGEGLSAPDIAVRLGVSRSAVRKYLQTAREAA